MTVNLYIGNHGKPDGIEDYIRFFREVLGVRGVPVQVSTALTPGMVNLVIDEFTNYRENLHFAEFKRQNPDSPVVILMTEFVVRRFGVRSFNLFGGLLDIAAAAFLNVYISFIRKDYPRAGLADCLRAILFFPVLLVDGAIDLGRYVARRLTRRRSLNPVRRFLRKHHRVMYFHWRYLGLNSFLRYADAVITSHEDVYGAFTANCGSRVPAPKNLGVIYPELDEADVLSKLMRKKSIFIEMTGTITKFRKRFIDRINRSILALGMRHVFGECRIFPIATAISANEESTGRGAFSLHPPQSRTWPYSSPTRVYRALAVEYNLPILTHHFGQNPIEDVCFVWKDKYSIVALFEMYHDRGRLTDFIGTRIRDYNRIARQRNDSLAAALVRLAPGQGEAVLSAAPRPQEPVREKARMPVGGGVPVDTAVMAVKDRIAGA